MLPSTFDDAMRQLAEISVRASINPALTAAWRKRIAQAGGFDWLTCGATIPGMANVNPKQIKEHTKLAAPFF